MIRRAEPIERFSGKYVFSACRGGSLRPTIMQLIHRRTEITKPQSLTGAIGQIAAGLTHRMTPDQLAKISASVPKVLIISASEDLLIPHTEGEKLKRYMPEAEYQCWEKTGHGLCGQHQKRFNQQLENVFEQGNEAVGKRVDSNGAREHFDSRQ